MYAVASTRSRRMLWGLFSPRSNSLRTTVISVSRICLVNFTFTMRSASKPNAHFRFSSVADGLVIVCAIERGGTVPGRAFGHDFVLDLPAVGGFDEIHVLQQVGHAGFAVALMAGADQVSHVDGDLRIGLVGVQEHPQAVGETIFGNASHGSPFLDARWQGLCESAHPQHQCDRRNYG